MLDSCIPKSQRLVFVCRVLQKVFDFVDIKPLRSSHLFIFRLIFVSKVTIAQTPIDTVGQSPRDTVAQPPQSSRDTKSETLRVRHLFFLSNSLSCPQTKFLRLRLLLLVQVGEPDVKAACPYPMLSLDKFSAALIRCLLLWTVTKHILVFFRFKGLYLLPVIPLYTMVDPM